MWKKVEMRFIDKVNTKGVAPQKDQDQKKPSLMGTTLFPKLIRPCFMMEREDRRHKRLKQAVVKAILTKCCCKTVSSI